MKRLLVLVFAASCFSALASCSGSSSSAPQDPSFAPTATSTAVPAGFAAACGRPGATVVVEASALPVTIARAACDLRGVIVKMAGGSDVVPGADPALPSSCTAGSRCPTIRVNPGTLDVTIE